MKIGIYPGSFNPWTRGHEDVLKKALKIYDKVIVAQGINSNKSHPEPLILAHENVEVKTYHCFLVDFIVSLLNDKDSFGLVRGLRNATDFQYEKDLQYVNEDLGLNIPVTYFICDRALTHISSSVMREISKR